MRASKAEPPIGAIVEALPVPRYVESEDAGAVAGGVFDARWNRAPASERGRPSAGDLDAENSRLPRSVTSFWNQTRIEGADAHRADEPTSDRRLGGVSYIRTATTSPQGRIDHGGAGASWRPILA